VGEGDTVATCETSLGTDTGPAERLEKNGAWRLVSISTAQVSATMANLDWFISISKGKDTRDVPRCSDSITEWNANSSRGEV
jgi:hypothetical protein